MSSRNPKSDPLRRLSSRFGADKAGDEDADEANVESDDTTRRQADPIADAQTVTSADPMIPIDEDDDDDDAPTKTFEFADINGTATPMPLAPPSPMKHVPPAPPRPARFDNFMPPPPLPSESPFDEFPPTPGPDPTFAGEDDAEFSETPLPARPHAPFNPPPPPQPFGGIPPAPALNFGGGPPPGRPALPRPGGYLDPGYGAGLHMPPAPPAPAVYDPSNSFGGGFPETVDFGRNSAPVVVRRSGPPGFVVLVTLLAGAAGGVWLAEKVTHNAVAALEASTAASDTTNTAPRKTPAGEPEAAPSRRSTSEPSKGSEPPAPSSAGQSPSSLTQRK